MDIPDYYETLEVVPHASPEVIRAAYKSLMQRHHPDRHPAHSAAASRATAIAQAYGVLSDAGQRAAYDLRLQQAQAPLPAAYVPPRPTMAASRRGAAAAAPSAPSNWYLWLLAAVILASGGLMLVLSGKQATPPPNLPGMQPQPDNRARADAAAHPAAAQTASADAPPPPLRRMALLASDLDVMLVSTDALGSGAESSRHLLSIPNVELEIGSIEFGKFADALARQKEQVVQKLADKLARAPYSELKIEGDRYLAKFILEALREITGTQGLDDSAAASLTHPTEGPRYGIVAVSLPGSFALR